jgi:hypothetical protein
MSERITVHVDGKPVTVFRGMKVKHTLIAFDYSLYKACLEGEATVRERSGFAVGLEGTVEEGTELFITKKGTGPGEA